MISLEIADDNITTYYLNPRRCKICDGIILYGSTKENRKILYCSDKCKKSLERNKHNIGIPLSDDRKNKIRKGLLESEKYINCKKGGRPRNDEKYKFLCKHCGGEGLDKYRRNKNRKYHRECWLKISGGLKEGSSRGKSGWYKGYWCDSSYELAFVIYNIDHAIGFERNREGFYYNYEEKRRLFFPDFIMSNGVYIEIKNFHSLETDTKISQFPLRIEILYKEDLKKEILPYVISKYGKNFIKLYENQEK